MKNFLTEWILSIFVVCIFSLNGFSTKIIEPEKYNNETTEVFRTFWQWFIQSYEKTNENEQDSFLKVHLQELITLVKNGADPNTGAYVRTSYNMPLCFAAKKGLIDLAAVLLEHGADTERAENERLWTPLRWAAYYGHPYLVSLLLSSGANAKATEDLAHYYFGTPLRMAEKMGHEAVVAIFLEFGEIHTLNNGPIRNPDEINSLLLPYISDNKNLLKENFLSEQILLGRRNELIFFLNFAQKNC